MSQDEHDYTPLPSVAEMFGELDGDVPTFQEQPQVPGPRSSAARHAARRRSNDLDAAMARVDDILDVARGKEADKAAYDRVMAGANAADDKVRAARYAKAHGIVPVMSSAQRIAAQAQAAYRDRPTEQDQSQSRRQREARRPRS